MRSDNIFVGLCFMNSFPVSEPCLFSLMIALGDCKSVMLSGDPSCFDDL